MSEAVLAFGGLRVLAAAAPGHLEWLEEFLGPAFVRADCHEADWRVSLVEDRERYRQALARGPADGTLEAFAFDAKVVGLPRWRTETADTSLFDAARGLLFEITYATRAVTLLTEPGNADARIALMRILRELGINRAQRRGGLLLHAAAMAVGDRGIVITGPKGAGKTSLLIHALRARSARYVSNDRVVVPAAASRPVATGVPTIVALRRGTLDLFPSLAARAAASGYAYQLTREEAVAAGPRPADPRGKPDSLSPAQLCWLLDVPTLAGTEIAAIVFPRITGEPGTFALRRLTEAEVAEEVPDMLFGVRGGGYTSSVFADPDEPPPDLGALTERCRDVASQFPCVECRLGLEAFDAADDADGLISAILRH